MQTNAANYVLCFMIFVVLVFGAVVTTIAYDYKQKTKWRDACLLEQRDEGYNHERAKRRCMMRWIEVEKANQ